MPFYLLVSVREYPERLRLDCLDVDREDARRQAERIATKGFWVEAEPATDRKVFCAPSQIVSIEVVEEP